MSEDLGTITPCYTMTFTRTSKHSPERMWAALTSDDEVSAWMEAPAKVDLRVGGSWFIDFESAGYDDPLDGIIVRVEPEKVLAYAWGRSVVEWTITQADDGCSYTFVHQGCSDRGVGEEGLAAGWHGFLDQLAKHLDGTTWTKDEAEAQWSALQPVYKEQLDEAIRQGR